MDVSELSKYHVVVIHNSHSWSYLDFIKRLIMSGKKVVYDTDDDFLSGMFYDSKKRLPLKLDHKRKLCIMASSIVTCSTPFFRARLIKILGLNHEKVFVIPNSLSTVGWKPVEETGSHDGLKRICWHGGNTHDDDWKECLKAVEIVLEKRDDVRLVIAGYTPKPLQERLELPPWKGKVELLGWCSIDKYFRNLQNRFGEVGLAPLEDKMFNHSKSNIKWMEYSLIGMPTVASEIHAFSDTIAKDCIIYCHNQQEWVTAIERCLDDEKLRKELIKKARDHIERYINIHRISEKLKQVLLKG
jgi:glycosyltransferase involved in cell wall biosynthesis